MKGVKKCKTVSDTSTNPALKLPWSIQIEAKIREKPDFDRLWGAVTLLILVGDQKFLVSDKALDPIR